MITDDFDNSTEPVVDPAVLYGEQRRLVGKCLILFSNVLLRYLLDHYDCAVIGSSGACGGNIYCFEYSGEKIAFYLSAIGSAMASAACHEAYWKTGASTFVMFGSCGSLDRKKTQGKYIIPSECYRGDGCSYYYAAPSDYLPVRNADRLSSVFDEIGIPYVKGRVWTTDSMLRETAGLIRKRRSEGCIAAEMELAGVQALCDFYGLELYDFLEPGDILDESGYDAGGLAAANHNPEKLFIALEIIKRTAGTGPAPEV